jgi:hypothetical protein
MFERYTLDFAGELGNKGVEHHLRHMGSDPKLLHAFPVLNPNLSESERVINEIVAWFEKHEPTTKSSDTFPRSAKATAVANEPTKL